MKSLLNIFVQSETKGYSFGIGIAQNGALALTTGYCIPLSSMNNFLISSWFFFEDKVKWL